MEVEVSSHPTCLPPPHLPALDMVTTCTDCVQWLRTVSAQYTMVTGDGHIGIQGGGCAKGKKLSGTKVGRRWRWSLPAHSTPPPPPPPRLPVLDLVTTSADGFLWHRTVTVQCRWCPVAHNGHCTVQMVSCGSQRSLYSADGVLGLKLVTVQCRWCPRAQTGHCTVQMVS